MIRQIIYPILLMLLTACGQEKNTTTHIDNSSVVAKIGSDVITQNQLDHQVQKLTGLSGLTTDQKLIKKNVIDSMVLAKLMAKKQLDVMTSDDLLHLDIAVKAYREELLAQQYMSENVKTLPPSFDDVQSYYKTNLHRFGGGRFTDITRYTLSPGCLLPQVDGDSNSDLESKILDLTCEKKSKKETLLLAKLASETGKNEKDLSTKKPIWLMTQDGQSIIFVKKIEERKAAPLSDVASDIRKMMAPMQFKSAIASLKSQLLKETEVEIFDN